MIIAQSSAQQLQITAFRKFPPAKGDSQVFSWHALKQEKGTHPATMTPTPTLSPREAERSSSERISRMCQKVRHRTKKAIEALRASSGADARVLEEISETLQQYIDDASQPKYHQALMKIFDFDHGIRLTKCICLGLGNFNIVPSKKDASQSSGQPRRSLHQLAILIVMLQILVDGHSIQEVYFQDPAFTKVEKKFLQSLGYTVLEDPAAFEKMSASTFLFAPFNGYDVACSAFAVSFPALFIGNSPAKVLEGLRVPKNSHREQFIAVFERFQNAVVDGELLPRFEEHSWTRNTTVHWRSP